MLIVDLRMMWTVFKSLHLQILLSALSCDLCVFTDVIERFSLDCRKGLVLVLVLVLLRPLVG